MNNDKCDQELLAEAYEPVFKRRGLVDFEKDSRIPSVVRGSELPSGTDSNVTHEYSDEELHQMAIVALKDMLQGTNITSRPKIEWLINMLQKRSRE
jgi:hypothetical protein